MSFKLRICILLSILLLVEATSYEKLATWLQWTSEPALAFASALAFLALLLGSIVALSAEAPPELVTKVRRLAAILLLVQALANTLISYMYARHGMPADVVVEFFNVRPDVALK